MPEISRFYGIVIRMYGLDHAPPHMHAVYAEHEALIGIDNIEVIRGSLPARARRLVFEWAELHQDELREHSTEAERLGAEIAATDLEALGFSA